MSRDLEQAPVGGSNSGKQAVRKVDWGEFLLLRFVVTFAALAAAFVHVLFPKIVPDAITAGFLLLAFVPWLAPLIESLEIPDLGKFGLRNLARKTEEASAAALSAGQKAEEATGAAQDANQQANLALAEARNVAEKGMLPTVPNRQELDGLAAENNEIRRRQRAGPARTSKMTEEISKMIRASVGLSSDEIRQALQESDDGKRLVGYAGLYAEPKPELIETWNR